MPAYVDTYRKPRNLALNWRWTPKPTVTNELVLGLNYFGYESSIPEMLAFLLGFFRLLWLFGKDHRAVMLENLTLRQQLAIYKRKQPRPRLVGRDRWFWIALSVVWKDWRRALCVLFIATDTKMN